MESSSNSRTSKCRASLTSLPQALEKHALHDITLRKQLGLGLAFRGLTAAMGPFIVVALAIEAATTYWKLYKDRVAEAAQAHADAMDKFRESTRAAVEENSNFAKSMDDAKTAAETMRGRMSTGKIFSTPASAP